MKIMKIAARGRLGIFTCSSGKGLRSNDSSTNKEHNGFAILRL